MFKLYDACSQGEVSWQEVMSFWRKAAMEGKEWLLGAQAGTVVTCMLSWRARWPGSLTSGP